VKEPSSAETGNPRSNNSDAFVFDGHSRNVWCFSDWTRRTLGLMAIPRVRGKIERKE
jgi:hypothetical protein